MLSNAALWLLLVLSKECTGDCEPGDPPFKLTGTFYEKLVVPSTCNTSAIRQAYRRQALRFHPDKNPDVNPKFFLAVAEAHTVLIDPFQRRMYDRKLARGGDRREEQHTDHHQHTNHHQHNNYDYDYDYDEHGDQEEPPHPHRHTRTTRQVTEWCAFLYILYLGLHLLFPAALQPPQFFSRWFSRTWVSADGSICRQVEAREVRKKRYII
jgi:curved DNA-binding protein CbpA